MSETPTSAARSSRPLPPDLSPRGRGRHGAADTGGAATVAGRTSGGRRLGRAVSWVAALFSLLILLGSGGGYLYTKSQFDSIKSIGSLCLKGCAGQPGEVGATENFLLVGTDTRSGANSTGANAGLNEQGAGVGATFGNSDTTLLVHISADTKKVIVISFPRDLLVNVPTYTPTGGTQVLGGQPEKFNYAYAVGGPQLLIKQVIALTHLPVDHYLSIDFAGFQSMVSALGGVTVCLSQDANDPGGDGSGGSGFHETKGVHKLDGVQALMYVRQRHGLPNGDLDRIQRQQRFLSALVRQAKAPSTLLNPIKLNNFLNAIVKNVSKDSGTTEQDLLGLVSRLKGLSPAAVEFKTVPTAGSGGGATDPLGDYLRINSTAAHTLFQAVSNDEDPDNPPKPKPSPKVSAAPTPTTAPLTVAPANVTLTVANGSGVAGKGAATSAELQGLGYHVSSVTTQTRSDPSSTVILYGADRADSAKTLAAAIPGAVATPDTADGSEALTLVVGTDYTAAKAVVVGPASPAAPTAAATTAAAVPTPTASASPKPQSFTAAATDSCGP